jgi:hypothetical protein
MERIFKVLAVSIVVIFAFVLIGANLDASMGFKIKSYQITSTGTTRINFGVRSQEIYVINYTTEVAYVNWTSSTVVVSTATDFAMGTIDSTDVIWHTEEISTSYMSVRIDSQPVHIFIQMKY